MSYEGLAFGVAAVADVAGVLPCRLVFDKKAFTKSSFQKNIKRVTAETWEAIHMMVTRKANELGIEKVTSFGRTARSSSPTSTTRRTRRFSATACVSSRGS